jgi:hypothetical protein
MEKLIGKLMVNPSGLASEFGSVPRPAYKLLTRWS